MSHFIYWGINKKCSECIQGCTLGYVKWKATFKPILPTSVFHEMWHLVTLLRPMLQNKLKCGIRPFLFIIYTEQSTLLKVSWPYCYATFLVPLHDVSIIPLIPNPWNLILMLWWDKILEILPKVQIYWYHNYCMHSIYLANIWLSQIEIHLPNLPHFCIVQYFTWASILYWFAYLFHYAHKCLCLSTVL